MMSIKGDNVVQYYIVNCDLNMTPGKIGAQIGHAAVLFMLQYSLSLGELTEWLKTGQTKVVLRAHTNDLEKIIASHPSIVSVKDNGLTEIPPGSLTVVALPPMKRSEAHPIVGRFQLL
jgi:PTH2 family peptidyl-tRNA hydrolase